MRQHLGIAGVGLIIIEFEARAGEVPAQSALLAKQGFYDYAAGYYNKDRRPGQ